MRQLFILIPFLFCASFPARACSGGSPTWIAASIAESDVQSCITAASAGDTINVPNGSTGTWANLTDAKGLTLACPGDSCTITSSSNAYTEQCPTSGTHFLRLTGFTFTGAGNSNNGDVQINGPTVTGTTCTARVDHNTFTATGTDVFMAFNNGTVQVNPMVEMLFDHNTVTGGSASEMLHIVGMGAGNLQGWSNDVIPGGPNMVFIEDNTFNCVPTAATCPAEEGYYGAQFVFRHNVLNFACNDVHGGPVSTRWSEIYDNTYNINNPSFNLFAYLQFRGGSGVYWGNTSSGVPCCSDPYPSTQFGPLPGSSDPTSGTWPLNYQVGRGINNTYSPAYTWGNGSPIQANLYESDPTYVLIGNAPTDAANCSGHAGNVCDVVNGGATQPTLERCESVADVTAGCPVSYTYTPYIYPNPLQGGSTPTVPQPQTPASLQSTVN